MYGLKYQSEFYNIFKTKVVVHIYKKDYSSSVINLRTTEVSLEVNNQDEPVIGTGLRVVIVNEEDFNSLNDLLTSREKEFECIVYYGNSTVFDGYSICDLNEQQFAPFAKITLQFTDYLRRLEGSFASCLRPIGGTADIYSILQDAMIAVGKTCNFNVNSSLFETRMNKTANDTFLEQTFVDNLMFYSDSTTYDSIYAALNKVLKSFNAYFYSMGDKWVLERYDDITRPPATQTWVTFANPLNSDVYTGTADANLRQVWNKQAKDFDYTELSQVVEYDSGLQKLILKLNDKQLDTFVFNDYKVNGMLTTPDQFPLYTSLDYKKWYSYFPNIISRTGLIFRGMTNYIEWQASAARRVDPEGYEFDGLYYHFRFTFNTPENYVINPDIAPETPTILNISFKQTCGGIDFTPVQTVMNRFAVTLNGSFLFRRQDPSGNLYWALSITPEEIRNDFDVSTTGNKDLMNSISESINLTDPISFNPTPAGTSGVIYSPIFTPSIWMQLGMPATVDAVIMFFPEVITTKPVGIFHSVDRIVAWDNYIGDIQVGLASQKIPNKLTYYINETFVKTETQEMDFFDLVNDNFANGPRMMPVSPPEGVKTEKWSTYQHPITAPLMDIYARVKFGNYCHTLHKLKGTIMCDRYLKPFAVLTDNNLKDESGNIIELILNGYTWNLNEGTYEIEALEFTEEIIGVIENSSGETSSDGGVPESFYVSVSPTILSWAWNDTSTKTFVVTTNMARWFLDHEYSVDEPLYLFTWYVYDSTNTTRITNGVYTSGMVIRVTPKANNVSLISKQIAISITNESNEVMPSGIMIGTQAYTNADNPPIITESVSDASFTLSYFNHTLATSSSILIIWWTPTASGLTDYDIYILVKRAGVMKAYAMFPHNTDGIEKSMTIPLSEAAIAGATYTVEFSTSSST